jgi:hypothetical protein
MANTNLIPSDYKTFLAKEIIKSSDDTRYYIFLGNHFPTSNTPTAPLDTVDSINEAYRNMILGKHVTTSDMSLMIKNIPYTSNTVYSMYDDSDANLDTENFYAVVNAGAYSHVWKVLDNNMDAVSTVPPDFSQVDTDNSTLRLSDGYLWKYMYSVDSTTVSKFATTFYFPLLANSDIVNSAVKGQVEVIKIDDVGSKYENYLLGTFSIADVRVSGNTRLYKIDNSASVVNGFYTGCNLYIASGTGIGQYKTIIDSFSNGNGNYIVIDSDFIVGPSNASEYEIFPTVQVTGSGQTSNAEARALVNTSSNTIYLIDVLNKGEDYTFMTANVIANSVVGVVPAVIRPIYAPYNGHGSDAASELNVTKLGMSLLFANTENNTVPADNFFRQIGVLVNPQFSNVLVTFTTSTNKNFILSENIAVVSTRYIQNNIVTTVGSANVTSNSAIFSSSLYANDWVYLQSESDASLSLLTQISSVTNNSQLSLSQNVSWTAQDTSLYLVDMLDANSVVLNTGNSTSIILDQVTYPMLSGNLLIGMQSGAFGTIDEVIRNGVSKNFETFIGMSKFVSNSYSGTFLQNELVSDVTTGATAFVHSFNVSSNVLTLYTTNTFSTFTTLSGANSGAVATVTTSYSPEILFDEGSILYLDNIVEVNRYSNETEQIKIIVDLGS